MKIKILKDIPGYKAGEIVEVEPSTLHIIKEKGSKDYFKYPYHFLIEEGFAEKIKDDIDIEAIRKHYKQNVLFPINSDEINWFNAFRIVKAVIDQLNGDWKPDWKNLEEKCNITYQHIDQKFIFNSWSTAQVSILPVLKDQQRVEIVIELCEPELKVLFGVK